MYHQLHDPAFLAVASGGTPALDLFFSATKALDSRITFSRGSSATQIGATGLVEYAPENLLLRSEEFDSVVWTKTNLTVSANFGVSPDGTSTADRLIEAAGTSFKFADALPSITAGTHTFSVFAKANGREWLNLQLTTGAVFSYFNLSGAGSTGTSGGITGSSIQALPNGWYRCSITASLSGTSTTCRILLANADNSANYNGDGTSGILLWGAQLERYSTARAYIPTTSAAVYGARFTHDPVTLASLGLLIEESRTNLLLRSEEIDNASWQKTRSTVSANAAVAPDGNSTADKLIEDTSTNTHFVIQNVAIAANAAYTLTVYLKAAERGFAQVWMANAATADRFQADINLSTGEVFSSALGGTPFTGGTASSQQLSNGWWRLVLTATTTGGAINLQTRIHISSSLGVTSYAGNGTSGILIWGAQLEAGAFATSYIPTTSATVTRAADVATMTGTNFSSWYNQSQGTAVVDLTYPVAAVDTFTMQFSQDGNNYMAIRRISANNLVIAARESSSVYDATVLTGTAGAGRFNVAFSYLTSSGVVGSANGSSPVTGSAYPNITATSLSVAGFGGGSSNQIISRIRYYRRRLPNANLQTLTT